MNKYVEILFVNYSYNSFYGFRFPKTNILQTEGYVLKYVIFDYIGRLYMDSDI